MAGRVEIVEVGPRDGLQNEATLVAVVDKLALVRRAVSAGARRIEATSFVNPRRVPQMADAEIMAAQLPRAEGVTYIGLALNERGAERAIAAGLDEVGAVCVSTDRFAMRNQGQDATGSLATAIRIVAMARAAGRSAQITIGASFGCPFEGEVSHDRIVAFAKEAASAGPREVALADTIGVAVPQDVARLVERVRDAIAPVPVRVHFHDTRSTGIANIWAAVCAGATVVDASIGGVGGCPFAPGASGNVATEDVAYLLHRSGFETGLDLDRLIEAAGWLGGVLGRRLPGSLSRSGSFPPAGAVQP